ncbi:MAG: NAD(+) diphosphatase [Synergistaceae bacterium]|nr:NAD(+) diphosphatase [Synergistaceae bacterium]
MCKPDGGLLSPEEAGGLEGYFETGGMVLKRQPCDTWGLLKFGSDVHGRDEYTFVSRRSFSDKGDDLFRRAGVAFQMMRLRLKNKYCGVCGGVMADHEQDRARVCPSCGNVVYAAPAPAVIVAVEKDGEILLGHNVNFPKGRYSVIAGFVDPGETLEETVAREVFEESRVRIKNIRYFGSQPWPFPNSMMFGFTADWESGDPTPDGGELSDVRWFKPSALPDLPPSVSISRKLIDGWLERSRNK